MYQEPQKEERKPKLPAVTILGKVITIEALTPTSDYFKAVIKHSGSSNKKEIFYEVITRKNDSDNLGILNFARKEDLTVYVIARLSSKTNDNGYTNYSLWLLDTQILPTKKQKPQMTEKPSSYVTTDDFPTEFSEPIAKPIGGYPAGLIIRDDPVPALEGKLGENYNTTQRQPQYQQQEQRSWDQPKKYNTTGIRRTQQQEQPPMPQDDDIPF